jgi:hypothetical protein
MTRGARNFVRVGMGLLIGAGVAACATGSTTPKPTTSTASGSPVVSASTSPAVSPIPATPDPIEGWLSFHSTAGQLSFRYDPTWRPVQCPPVDSPLIVLGHNVCGQIEPSFEIDSVHSVRALPAPDMRCDPSQPPAVSSIATVDGVTGTREYIDYTEAAYQNCRLPIMHAVAYAFYTSGREYTIMYLYIPSEGADQTTSIDRMVQTLTFSA